MKHTLIIKEAEFRAVRRFCSDDESRFVLNGVHVECVTNGKPILAATDGRRLLVLETTDDSQIPPPQCAIEFTISRMALDMLLARRPDFEYCEDEDGNEWQEREKISFCLVVTQTDEATLQVEIITSCGLLTLNESNGGLIGGKFPKWREVCPKDETVKPITDQAINPEYLTGYRQAANILGSKSGGVMLRFHGEFQAVEVFIESLPQFYGVVMPMRWTGGEISRPEFINAAIPTASNP